MIKRKVKVKKQRGFTLIELLVATVIFVILLAIIFNITSQTNKVWSYSASKIESFQSARFAFETITRTLSEATLNTYYDYYDASGERRTSANASSFIPAVYGRYSDLEFVAGKNLVSEQRGHAIFFQTPIGYTQKEGSFGKLRNVLNTVGFFVSFRSDSSEKPSFVGGEERFRYRLVQLLQPTEEFSVYQPLAEGKEPTHHWFTDPISEDLPNPNIRILADNIIVCVFWPKMPEETPASASLASQFDYDSVIANATPPIQWSSGVQPVTMNQLPPVVRVLLIAADERTMSHLPQTSSEEPDLGFDYTKVFQSVYKLEEDLKTVSDALAERGVNFRVFQADVALKTAKWSP